MKLNTTSSVITFAENIENNSAKFYENLNQKFSRNEDLFSSFIKENAKHIVQIKRAYYGVITDAIESCFVFDIEGDSYDIDTLLTDNMSYFEALKKLLLVEETIVKFYSIAAEQSKSLMADIPRAFTLVAKKRNNRISKIKALMG